MGQQETERDGDAINTDMASVAKGEVEISPKGGFSDKSRAEHTGNTERGEQGGTSREVKGETLSRQRRD